MDFTADRDAFAKAWAGEGGTDTVIADWSATLDFLEAEEGARPTGWWGLSMGTMMGLPVTASDDRIRVAVLGLMGTWGPNGEELKALANGLPVRFDTSSSGMMRSSPVKAVWTSSVCWDRKRKRCMPIPENIRRFPRSRSRDRFNIWIGISPGSRTGI